MFAISAAVTGKPSSGMRRLAGIRSSRHLPVLWWQKQQRQLVVGGWERTVSRQTVTYARLVNRRRKRVGSSIFPNTRTSILLLLPLHRRLKSANACAKWPSTSSCHCLSRALAATACETRVNQCWGLGPLDDGRCPHGWPELIERHLLRRQSERYWALRSVQRKAFAECAGSTRHLSAVPRHHELFLRL